MKFKGGHNYLFLHIFCMHYKYSNNSQILPWGIKMNIPKFLCCTDFSENSERAFRTALEMAKENGAKLSLIHILSPIATPLFTNQTYKVLPPTPKNSLIIGIEERMEDEYGTKIDGAVDYEIIVRNGHISSEIIGFVEENDINMIILGSYGRKAIALSLFGSVVKKISRKARCPIMIVRGRDGIDRRSVIERRYDDIPLTSTADRRGDTHRRSGKEKRVPAATYYAS